MLVVKQHMRTSSLKELSRRLPWWAIFIVGMLWGILADFLIRELFHSDLYSVGEDKSLFILIIEALIAAPIIETFLFQFAVIEICHKYLISKNENRNILISIVASAALFSLSHYYSWQYILWTFIAGIYIAFVYLHFKTIHQSKAWGYWMTVAFHCTFNSLSLLSDVIERCS